MSCFMFFLYLEEMKRIPSKKDSVGSSPQYVNYQTENEAKGSLNSF